MAHVYASQYQQWAPQQPVSYDQQLYNHYSQHHQPYEVPSNVLRPVIQQPTMPITSYSSLAGALDYTGAQSASPRKKSTGSIYKTRVNGNPYPVSQHDATQSPSSTRRNSQTLLLAAASRSARQCSSQDLFQGQRVTNTPAPPPSGPTNHVMIPQMEYLDEMDRKWRYGPRYPPVDFKIDGMPELGVRVGKVVHSHHAPLIQGAQDAIFDITGDREIKLWILVSLLKFARPRPHEFVQRTEQWPGYSAEPFRKRIKTQAGKITRELFLTVLANAILDYTYEIHRCRVPIDPGYEKWAIGTKQERGILGVELFITRIVHRGGSNWQVELWAPNPY